jgi:ABC-2 type transport system ATP-binding protein
MAMLHGPKVVFLDEPTIGLDVIAKERIRDFIRAMNERGTSFVLTTHDLEDVERLARKVIIINHGKKVFDDDLSALKKSLGEKKIVHLTLERPVASLDIPNATVTTEDNPLELTIEADVSKMPVSALVRYISERCDFTDISIKELPMERVITAIYRE